ncbi:MAG: Bacterial leucyl aminopeptidase precursor [Acidobacteria bacterium]|nr:Bacterial leucyl aminopeptidase precursor [Acidobacteriota bacterium]
MRIVSALVCFALLSAGCARHAITASSVRGHMEFLASDAMNGRGSATRDEWIAATYIGSQLRRWGVEPLGDDGGYVQAVALARVQISAPPVLSAEHLRFTHAKEMIVQGITALRLSGPLQKFQAGAAVATGAIVLLPEGSGAEAAATMNAAAVLTIENAQSRSRWDVQGARPLSLPARIVALASQAAGPSRPTRITLDRGAYAAIAALADGTAVSLDATGSETMSRTWNAVGRLQGRDAARSQEAILLSAHLDHLGSSGTGADPIFNGADDDASGSAAVLELAEALAKGKRPKRTIIFAWFGSEEAGGYGARYFVERPPVPLDRIVANLEFEMIGRPDHAVAAHTLWLTGYERSNLGPELARRGARIVADPHPDQNFFERSDNITLARKGVVAQTVSSYGLHTDYHQPSDDLGHLDLPHMTDSIASMLRPVRWLANGPFHPAWLPGKRP